MRSTRTRDIRMALRRALQFEDEYQRRLVGLSSYEHYRRPLAMFVDPFLSSLDCGDMRRAHLRAQLERAFRLLNLKCLADLENFIKIEKRLLRLEGFSTRTLMRCFQAPLKQFSRYLAGRQEVPVDHLIAWPRIKVRKGYWKERLSGLAHEGSGLITSLEQLKPFPEEKNDELCV